MDDTPSDAVQWRTGDGKFGMTPTWVTEHPNLDSNAVRLYTVLATIATWETGVAEVSQERLAQRMGGVSTRTVQRAQAQLVEIGALVIEPTHHERYGKGWNRYLLSWVSPPSDKSVATPSDTDGATHTTTLSQPIQTVDIQTGSVESIGRGQRDAIWDHLEGVFGYRPLGDETAMWGRLVNLILQSGVPPEEVPRRALIWAYHYDTPLTPATLLHKWQWLGGRTARITRAERAGVRKMLDEQASQSDYWAAIKRGVDGDSNQLPKEAQQ